jgi:hypothetical protein
VKANDAPVAATIVPATVVFVSVEVHKDSQIDDVSPQSASISTSRFHWVVPLVAYAPPTVMPVMVLSVGTKLADTIWSVNAMVSTTSVTLRPVITFDAAMIFSP